MSTAIAAPASPMPSHRPVRRVPFHDPPAAFAKPPFRGDGPSWIFIFTALVIAALALRMILAE